MKPEVTARLLDLGLLVLRVAAGGTGVLHGGMKIRDGVPKFAENLKGMNVPMPEVSAWLATGAELIGGALILVGLFTRLATIPFLINMAVAFSVVHDMKVVGPNNGEHALLVGLVLMSLLLTGPGRFSLDEILLKRRGLAQ